MASAPRRALALDTLAIVFTLHDVTALKQWLERQPPGAKTRMQNETRLAYTTIHNIAEGRTTPTADTALKIEAATGGEVTAAELLGVAGEAA